MPPNPHFLDKNMAKPLTQTTSMDAVLNEREPKVNIQRHSFDWQSLADDVGARVARLLRDNPTGCLFFNPAVTVSSPVPSPDFFQVVRKEQARWCRQAAKIFPQRVRRSSSKWVGGGRWISDKYGRYLERALCFTGILIAEGKIVPPHQWTKVGEQS